MPMHKYSSLKRWGMTGLAGLMALTLCRMREDPAGRISVERRREEPLYSRVRCNWGDYVSADDISAL